MSEVITEEKYEDDLIKRVDEYINTVMAKLHRREEIRRTISAIERNMEIAVFDNTGYGLTITNFLMPEDNKKFRQAAVEALKPLLENFDTELNNIMGEPLEQEAKEVKEVKEIKAKTEKSEIKSAKSKKEAAKSEIKAVKSEIGTAKSEIKAVKSEIGTVKSENESEITLQKVSEMCESGKYTLADVAKHFNKSISWMHTYIQSNHIRHVYPDKRVITPFRKSNA